MHSQIWVVSTLLISIVLIVLTIVKFKFHPFLALLLASFFVGTMMGMGPLDMVMLLKVELAERWGSSLRLSALARYWEK